MAAAASSTTAPALPPSPHPPPAWSRWTPSLPSSLGDLLNPFRATSHPECQRASKAGKADAEPAALLVGRPVLSAPRVDSRPPSPTRSSGSAMFAEPDTPGASHDSREGSVDGAARRLKKNRRPRTMFSICHPPPESKMKQKLHRRPRALLQLHRLQAAKRPLPALEVVPSANFSIRLTRAITKVITARHGMCPTDLVVLKAEKYSTEEATEEQEAPDVVGLICKGRRDEDKAHAGKMFIHMASGRIWEAYATANGAYECCTTDEHGLDSKVRWVPKRNRDGSKAEQHEFRRFNFSTISPNTRRHPVIATLSKSGLDVNDSYKMPDAASAATPLGTPKAASTTVESATDDESGAREFETDNVLRDIISVTAIWVAFKEGWSPSFRFDEKPKDHPDGTPDSPRRSVASPVATPPGSPGNLPPDMRNSLKSVGSGIMRRASLMSRSNRSSIASMPESSGRNSPTPSRSASVNLGRVGRARADSSSTVLVHRAASNRRKKYETGSFRPDLAITNDLHEASKEDLARELHGTPATEPHRPLQSPLANVPVAETRPVTALACQTKSDRHGSGGHATPANRGSRSVTPDQIVHRASTATGKTMSSAAQRLPGHAQPNMGQGPKQPSPTRRRKWRKMLCGMM